MIFTRILCLLLTIGIYLFPLIRVYVSKYFKQENVTPETGIEQSSVPPNKKYAEDPVISVAWESAGITVSRK